MTIKKTYQSVKGVPVKVWTKDLDKKAEEQRFFDRVLADDQVTIPVQTSGTGLLAGSQVRYRVIRGTDGTHKLARTVGPLHSDVPPMAGQTFLIQSADVIRFRVEYAEDGVEGWVGEWYKPTLPRAVRISMTLADRNPFRTDRQVSLKAVFPISVQ